MQVTWDSSQRAVLTCSGNIGWEDRDNLLNRLVETIAGAEQPELVMDFEAVDFVNSAGLGALLQAAKLVADRAGRLVITKVPPHLLRLFNNVRLDRLVPLTATMDEARQRLSDGAG